MIWVVDDGLEGSGACIFLNMDGVPRPRATALVEAYLADLHDEGIQLTVLGIVELVEWNTELPGFPRCFDASLPMLNSKFAALLTSEEFVVWAREDR